MKNSTLKNLRKIELSGELMLDLPGQLATASSGGKRLYNPPGSTHCYLTLSNAKSTAFSRVTEVFPVENLIIGFYEWDYILDVYDTEEKYGELLDTFWAAGVRNVVQYDFSVWYQEDEEKRLMNMYRNFRYMEIAQQKGFHTLLNFNNIMLKYMSVYKEILPKKLNTVVIDANHSESAYSRHESIALNALLEDFGVHSVIVRTGKRITKRLQYILVPCKAHNAQVLYSPTEMYFMAFSQKQVRELQGQNEPVL